MHLSLETIDSLTASSFVWLVARRWAQREVHVIVIVTEALRFAHQGLECRFHFGTHHRAIPNQSVNWYPLNTCTVLVQSTWDFAVTNK